MGFHIGLKDFIDIFLVAVLLYQTFKLLKRTGAVNIFIGILAFIICWVLVSFVFKMELLGGIFDRVISVGAFALIVLFQDEIRRFFSRIGSRRKGTLYHTLKRFFGNNTNEKEKTDFDLIQIVLACRSLSKNLTGALIILTRNNNLDFYTTSGEQINANINSRLIENIFFKNSPLHDGALIISNRKLKAAACILPVSQNQSIPKRLGLRHRAALGITEHSDAIAIVVSEETGHISFSVNGQLSLNVKPEHLEHFLTEEMTP
jgi:diadenylate cyclase